MNFPPYRFECLIDPTEDKSEQKCLKQIMTLVIVRNTTHFFKNV